MGLALGYGLGLRNQLAFGGKLQELSIDINYLSAESAISPLTIPGPYGDSTCIHPYVIDFLIEYNIPQWNGYRYWIGYTPFLAGEADENPCILASNDGVSWEVPAGLTNPIAPYPGGSSYNADIFLYFDKSTNTLHALWRTSNAYIRERHTTDGVNWSDQITLFSFSYSVDHNDYWLAPSVVKNGSNIYIYSKDIEVNKVYRHTAQSITGAWMDRTELTFDLTGCLINEINLLSGSNALPWHTECRFYKGYYYLLIYLKSAGGYPLLWMAKSKDGLTFKFAKYPVIPMHYDITTSTNVGDYAWDMRYYKSSFIPYEDNGVFKMKLWYVGQAMNSSAVDVPYIGFTEISKKQSYITINESSNDVSADRVIELAKASALTDGYFFGDDCNRSSLPLVSSCGKSYTPFISGATFSMLNNFIVNGSGTISSGLSIANMPLNYDVIIQWINKSVSTSSDSYPNIFMKYVSAANYLGLREGLRSSKIITTYSGGTIRPTPSRFFRNFVKEELNELRIKVNGANIKVYINGAKQSDYTLTVADFSSQATMDACLANTTFGIQFPPNTNDKIKNITVKAL